MTDQQIHQQEVPAQDNKTAIIAAETFIASDFEAPIAGITNVQTFELSSAYYKAANETKKAGDEAKAAAYVFLGHLMGIMLRATDKATPWGAQWEMTDGNRSMLPSDATEQIAELIPLLSVTKNPVLRARMADLIWWNDKSQASAARTAVESYVETVTMILDGKLHGYGDVKNSHQHDALHALQRGMSIANAISKKGALHDSITSATKALYEAAKNSEGYVVCAEAAEMGCRTKIFDEVQVAKDLESLVVAAPPGIYPEAVRKASDLAAYLYCKNKDEAGKERCQLHSVRLILAMSDACPQASAKASWVMDAIQALGKMKGHQALVSEMKKVLRELQEASTQEYVTISTPLDIGDDREAMLERFLGFDLSDALMNFALLERSPSKEKLRQEATDGTSSSPLMAMMGMHHTDGKGKVVAKTDGARPDETPTEEWYDTTINRNEGLRRQLVVGAGIDPARLAINQKFSIIEEYLEPIVSASWIVPASQKPIMILGFTRFIQGDFMSAVHLIVPQLEPCLRNILQLVGVDTAKRRNDSTEEDQDLGYLFRNHREAMERVLGPDLVYELELLFDRKTGDRLRHLVAHGNVSGGGCYSPDAIYACWLLYRVCCLPVLKDDGWNKIVRPGLP